MSTFFLQSALLIAVAYFLGAIVGCWLRKLFKQSASLLHTEPVAAGVAGAGAIAASQYSGAQEEASIEINRPESVPVPEQGPEPVRKVYIEEIPENLSVEQPFVPELEPETVTFVEAKTQPLPEPEPVPEPVSLPKPVFSPTAAVILEAEPEPEPEIEIVEPEVREPVVIKEEIVPEVAPVVEPEVGAAPVEEIIDDLTRIKGVGLPVALELKKNGIRRFEQVARWTDAEAAQIGKKLGFSGRIERENWMEQARILLAGDELEFTTHQLERAERAAHSHSDKTSENNDVAHAKTSGSASDRSGTSLNDLKLIIGIDTNMAEKLGEMGIHRLEQIANWTPGEIEALERQLGARDRITRERWVQQARQLIG